MTRIERHVETDLPVEEVDRLVRTAEGWEEWLVDRADVEVRPGASGTVVDDGFVRQVDVHHVDERSVRFTWRDGDGRSSEVAITFDGAPGGVVRVGIVERLHPTARATAEVDACLGWEGRALLLALAPLRARGCAGVAGGALVA